MLASQQKVNILNNTKEMLKGYEANTLARELIQNADDAEASSLEFRYVEIKEFPAGSPWNRPAVVISNDGPVSSLDFDRLQEVIVSGKTGNPFKIGRFGVGKVALFAVSDAHLVRAVIEDPESVPIVESRIIAAMPRSTEGTTGHPWDTDEEVDEDFKARIFRTLGTSPESKISLVVPLRREEDGGELTFVQGWREWGNGWFRERGSALQHWRAMAQILPLTSHLRTLTVQGLDWKATWELKHTSEEEKAADSEFQSLRRCRRLLTPPGFDGFKPDSRDPLPEDSETREFHGTILETLDDAPIPNHYPYQGWEFRLSHKRTINGVSADQVAFPVPHSAILRIGSPDQMEDHLRQVVFIGLGDMHIEGDQGLNGLILHANGECDLARTHLVSLSLTEGKSFKGEFNKRILREGLLPLLPEALSRASNLDKCITRLQEHDWVIFGGGVDATESNKRLRRVWNGSDFRWQAVEPETKVLPLRLVLPVRQEGAPESITTQVLSRLANLGLPVVDNSGKGFSKPLKLMCWEATWLDAIGLSRPEESSDSQVEEWYTLLNACRVGSNVFPITDRPWMQVNEGDRGAETWVCSANFSGFKEGERDDPDDIETMECIRAACPSITWVSANAASAFGLKEAAEATFQNLKAKIANVARWGEPAQRVALASRIISSVGGCLQDREWRRALRTILAGVAVQDDRILHFISEASELAPCLQHWVESTQQGQAEFSLLPGAMADESLAHARDALGLKELLNASVLEALVGEPLLDTPIDFPGGRQEWGRAVLVTAAGQWEASRVSDWKELPCHGDEGDTAWGESWWPFNERTPRSEILRSAATACGHHLYVRPSGIDPENTIWKNLEPKWNLPESLKYCWEVASPWAGTLFDAMDQITSIIQDEELPQDVAWLTQAPEGVAPPEVIRARAERLLESYISAKSWNPIVPEHLRAWQQLPYHGTGSELKAWQPQWYTGQEDLALMGAARVLGATVFRTCPFPPDSQSENFWSQLPVWTLAQALADCADKLGSPAAVPDLLDQIAPLLEASGHSVTGATIASLAAHTQWLAANNAMPEQQAKRAARVLALWAHDQGAPTPALQMSWQALPLFRTGNSFGPWSALHLQSPQDRRLQEGAQIVGRTLVKRPLWPDEPWCHEHHAVRAYWGALPKWERPDDIVVECLRLNTPRCLTWVATWFDSLGVDNYCPQLNGLISNLGWLCYPSQGEEPNVQAEYRRAGRLLGLRAASQRTLDAETRQAWRDLPLHGNAGHLGAWSDARRIVRVSLSEDHKAVLREAARVCGRELIWPGNLPANLQPWEAHLAPYLTDIQAWTLQTALEEVLDAGAISQIKPLLGALAVDKISLGSKRRVMVCAWIPDLARRGEFVPPTHVLLEDRVEWPDWLPAPPLPGWKLQSEVDLPQSWANWWLPVEDLEEPQARENEYSALIRQMRSGLLEDELAPFTLFPQDSDLDQEQIEAFLATIETGNLGTTTWDKALRWAAWLRERDQFDLLLVKAQEDEALPPTHWREGLQKLCTGPAWEGDAGGYSQDLARALARAWGRANGDLRPGPEFAGMILPNDCGQWVRAEDLAAEAGHQDPAATLANDFRQLLGLGEFIAGDDQDTAPIVGEALTAYFRDVANHTGDDAAATRVLLGIFLAACGPTFDPIASDLLSGLFQPADLRAADWIGTYQEPLLHPRFIEGRGKVPTLAGGWLNIDTGQSWYIQAQDANSFLLAPRDAGCGFLELRTGVLEILKKLNMDETVRENISGRVFDPDQVDIALLAKKIRNNVPAALKLMLRFIKGEQRVYINSTLEREDKLQEQLDQANAEGLGDKATALYKKRMDLIDGVENKLAKDNEGHKALGEAAKSYIAKLGYSEDRVLFELFQNADDAAGQWATFGNPAEVAPSDRSTFEVVDGLLSTGTPTLVIKHWGRPIGMWMWKGQRPGPTMWRDDLVKMLRFHESGKEVEGQDRGFFGLGFKSIYLLTWEPFIFSGTAWMRIRGALWPKKMLPNDSDFTKALQDFGLDTGQLPCPDNPYTCFAFRMSGQDSVNRSRKILEEFFSQARPTLAFASTLKQIRKKDGEIIDWSPETTAVGSLKLERMQLEEVEWHSYAEKNVGRPDRHVMFSSRNDKLEANPKLPTLWALAPTKVFWGSCALCLNGDLMLDTGRTEVQGAEDHNRGEFEALGKLTMTALLNWADDSASRKKSMWQSVGKPLAEFLRTGSKTTGAPHFSKALSALWWSNRLLPVGSGGAFVAGQSVQFLLEGADDWEGCPSAVLAWLQDSKGICLDLGTWEQLQCLRGVDPTGPQHLRAGQTKFPTEGGGASPAGEVFLPTDQDWESNWAEGHRLDLAKLCLTDEDPRALAWFRKIRPVEQFQRYRAELMRQHLRLNPTDVQAQTAVRNDGHLYSQLRELVRTSAETSDNSIQSLVGISEEQGLTAGLKTYLTQTGITEKMIRRQFEPESWVLNVAEAWKSCSEKDTILAKYRSEFQSPIDFQSSDSEVWRQAWFRLMVFSAAHSLGRIRPTTGQGFVAEIPNVPALVQPGLDPKDLATPANKAWLNRLYEQAQALADGGSQEGDFTFRSLYAVMHRISWQLDNYRMVMDSLRYEEHSAKLRFIVDPNTDVQWEGSLLSPTIPLVPVLGTMGFFVLLRELQRIEFLDTPNLIPHGFVPFGRLRRKLEIDQNRGTTLGHSKRIFQVVKSALGDGHDLTFDHAFEIPMLAAIDGHLPLD
jgi:hypothetical protein